jgi:HSP20 family protein
MSHKNLVRQNEFLPLMVNDFFKPWNGWLENEGNIWGKTLTVPAVNVSENTKEYKLSIAAPGMKKNDFQIHVEANVLTISAETKMEKEEKEEEFTRKEYNYSSFARSFTLPNEVNKDKIEATYEEGVLKMVLPKTEAAKKIAAKQIAVK